MPHLKLTYFDIHGGRGESARLALHIGGVAFEDERISFEEFRARHGSYPFGRVPVLHIDEAELSQCNSINRYVGKRSRYSRLAVAPPGLPARTAWRSIAETKALSP